MKKLIILLASITSSITPALYSCSNIPTVSIQCDEHIRCLDIENKNSELIVHFELLNIDWIDSFKIIYKIDKEKSSIEINKSIFKVSDLSIDDIDNTITVKNVNSNANIKVNLFSYKLEEYCNQYAENYNSNFFNDLSYDMSHKYSNENFENFHCNSEMEAIFNWSWCPGYAAWNHLLHDGKGDTSSLDNDEVIISQATPWKSNKRPINEIKGEVRLKDWRHLNNALLKSKLNKRLTLYHGLEPDETDFCDFFKTTSGFDINLSALETRQKFDSYKFVNKSYIDYGFLAMSFDLETPKLWAKSSTNENSIIFVLDIDPDVFGAYISYTNKLFFDGFYLASPYEYQLLLNRKANITFTGAKLYPNEDKNIIYMFGQCHKQTELEKLDIL